MRFYSDEDDELLESIARKGRMMRVLSRMQATLVKEAENRGISQERILDAVRSNPDRTEYERNKSRSSNRKERKKRADAIRRDSEDIS